VAGATIMAIGTSFADLMISVIALFVSKSTVGLGTIVGSELFNHLVVSSACAFNSKTGLIPLNKNLFTREVVFYALTLTLMIACLSSGSFASENFHECITVYWYNGFILMVAFVLYALVVIYFEQILNYFFPLPKVSTSVIATQTNPIADMSTVISNSIRELRTKEGDLNISSDGGSSADREITTEGVQLSDVSTQKNSNDDAVNVEEREDTGNEVRQENKR
jgi:hypothetical protein